MAEYIVEKKQTSCGWTWAEPKGKLIRCKDCRFYKEENLQCMMHEGDAEEWYDNDYCSLAERNEE